MPNGHYRSVDMTDLIQNEATVLKLRLPCLGYEGFDRTGKYPLWMVAKLFEMIRSVGYQNRSRFGKNSLMTGYGVSLLAGKYALSQRWYEKTQHVNYLLDLVMSLYLVHIGKTSLHFYNELCDARTGERYVCVMFRMVHTDLLTHRPKDLPKWLTRDPDFDLTRNLQQIQNADQNLLDTGLDGRIPLVVTELVKPETAFSCPVTIAPSLIDRNNHTNNSHYIRFCLDCATEAVEAGKFSGFHGDLAMYNVRRAQVLYRRETLRGDCLLVYAWPSEAIQLELCFLIEKVQETVFSCTISFYPLTSAKY